MSHRSHSEVIDLRPVLRRDFVASFDNHSLAGPKLLRGATKLIKSIRPTPIDLIAISQMNPAVSTFRGRPLMSGYLFALQGLSRIRTVERESAMTIVEVWTRLSYLAQDLVGMSKKGRRAFHSAKNVRMDLRRLDLREEASAASADRQVLQSKVNNLDAVARYGDEARAKVEQITSFFHTQGMTCRSVAGGDAVEVSASVQALIDEAIRKVAEIENVLVGYTSALRDSEE